MRHHSASQIRPKINTQTPSRAASNRKTLRSTSGTRVVSANRKKLLIARNTKLTAVHSRSRVRVFSQDRIRSPAQVAHVNEDKECRPVRERSFVLPLEPECVRKIPEFVTGHDDAMASRRAIGRCSLPLSSASHSAIQFAVLRSRSGRAGLIALEPARRDRQLLEALGRLTYVWISSCRDDLIACQILGAARRRRSSSSRDQMDWTDYRTKARSWDRALARWPGPSSGQVTAPMHA